MKNMCAILIFLFSTAPSFAGTCKMSMSVGPLFTDYEEQIKEILQRKHYEVTFVNDVNTGHISWIYTRSAGDMQMSSNHYVDLVTEDGEAIASTTIPLGFFSNRQGRVMRFLETVKDCPSH